MEPFPSAAGGRISEEKGVAAVEKFEERAKHRRFFRVTATGRVLGKRDSTIIKIKLN